LLFICIFLFAYSTIVCWYYYGSECAAYLFGARVRAAFFLAFIFFVSIGALGELGVTLAVTDGALLPMSVITLLTLVRCSDRIRALTDSEGLIPRRRGTEKGGKHT
jgi:AGCS family alanine or glycine:cation symporter